MSRSKPHKLRLFLVTRGFHEVSFDAVMRRVLNLTAKGSVIGNTSTDVRSFRHTSASLPVRSNGLESAWPASVYITCPVTDACQTARGLDYYGDQVKPKRLPNSPHLASSRQNGLMRTGSHKIRSGDGIWVSRRFEGAQTFLPWLPVYFLILRWAKAGAP